MINVILILLNFLGALALLLYGMNMLSNGIQKGAASSLQRLLGIVSGNRFTAVLTGMLVTAIIQSSGATTVMVVSFVNAQIISLTQAIGIIFGANIGTTITAWIVSLFGFSFKIVSVAIPLFGIGFFITRMKKWKLHDLGEILMGFGLLFYGLSKLSDSLTLGPESVAFLQNFSNWGFGGLLLGIIIGALITALIHSSSAMTAIVLTMAANGSLTWEFSAAVVLGSNIGSTIDAILSSFGASKNAKRAALVHVAFNIAGTILALIVFNPFLKLIDYIVPKTPQENITTHIAMLHTVFNICCTAIFLPFVNQIAAIVSKIIEDGDEILEEEKYKLPMIFSSGHGSIELYVLQAEKEIEKMASRVMLMFDEICMCLKNSKKYEISDASKEIFKQENYIDQMMEEITAFLVKCSQLDGATGLIQNKITQLLQITDYLENISDESTGIIYNIDKYFAKRNDKEQADKLLSYMEKVKEFYDYVLLALSTGLTKEQRVIASKMEDEIDDIQKVLKKNAKKRLEDGLDVKGLLRYIDIVRRIESAGDCIYDLVRVL